MACPPGMRGCAATCGHRMFVDGYRQERQRQEIAAEEASLGYTEELTDWLRDNPMPTFKDWMIQSKREQPAVEITTEWNDLADERARAFAQSATVPLADEASLLAIGLNTDGAMNSLRAVKTEEFALPFHRDIHRAILDQVDGRLPAMEREAWFTTAERAALGRPVGAQRVNDLLRDRGQLPMGYDPNVPMRTIDPERYGLAVWQANALPADSAGFFASQVRSGYRAKVLEDIGTRTSALARGSLERMTEFSPVTDNVGEALLAVAQEMVNLPPELGWDAKPVAKMSTSSAVPVWEPMPRDAITTAAPVSDLRLPPRPVLSPQGQRVLSLHGA